MFYVNNSEFILSETMFTYNAIIIWKLLLHCCDICIVSLLVSLPGYYVCFKVVGTECGLDKQGPHETALLVSIKIMLIHFSCQCQSLSLSLFPPC